MSIDNINNVLFAFVLIIMIIDGLLSYSSIVYGVKEVKNKYLIWLVVHTGFPGMLIFTRGAVLLLYCLFTEEVRRKPSCFSTWMNSVPSILNYVEQIIKGVP
jgi:hypothetical protein